MSKIYKIYTLGFLACFIGLFMACVSDDNLRDSKTLDNNELYFFLKVPQENIGTRTMTEEDTYAIDFSTVKLYLFKEGKFFSEGVLDLSSQNYNEEEEAYEIKITDIERDNSVVDFVILANETFNTPNKGEAKEDYYKRLRFNVDGLWSTDPVRNLPLWGEIRDVILDENVGTKYNPDKLKTTMLRSVARIDVISSEPEVDPEAAKAFKFYLTDTYVVRSLNEGYIVPALSNYDHNNTLVTKPSVYQDALYNTNSGIGEVDASLATKDPLSYKFDVNGVSEVTSKIFVPEQSFKDENSYLTLVVGGITASNLNKTYYRIDFHEPIKGDKTTYQPIDLLRNHRYIINIKGVRGDGYASIEAALAAGPTNINVDFVIWDEAINEGYIFGDKYFGINSSELYFDEHIAGQVDGIHMQCNLTIDQLKEEVSFQWKKGSLFDAKFDDSDGLDISVTTLTENKGNQLLEDVLYINAYEHEFEVKVTQNTMKPDYRLLCDRTEVFGVYEKDVPLTKANYIEVTVRSEQNIQGLRYVIETDEIDGLKFKGEGNFNMIKEGEYYYEKIKLNGSGVSLTSIPKIVTIIPNSKQFHVCEAEVRMAYSAKKIVGVSHGNQFGYATDTGDSEVFRKSKNCFGLEEYSVIKVPELTTFEYLDDSSSDTSAAILEENLIGTDILILGYNLSLARGHTRYANVVANYLHKGGVVIFMNESTRTIEMIFRALYNDNTLTITSNSAGGSGTRYPFITQPGDPVSDGPFGCVHGKLWGEDASRTKTVIGIPEEDIVIYSNSVADGKEEEDEDQGITSCRHTKYNLFFIGDAGFISQGGTQLTNRTICPFMIDKETGMPIPKHGYGPSARDTGTVHNSIFFGNVLAWAIDRAEFHGINTGK